MYVQRRPKERPETSQERPFFRGPTPATLLSLGTIKFLKSKNFQNFHLKLKKIIWLNLIALYKIKLHDNERFYFKNFSAKSDFEIKNTENGQNTTILGSPRPQK